MSTSTPPDLLTSVLSRYTTTPNPGPYPRVTLTFAQSLDAKIAGRNGKQLILSGRESMVMTHWMRTMHDGILVGIGTALNDDPQLNTRHLPPLPPGSPPRHLPRPIILDSRLRLSPTCKLLTNYASGIGRRPWVICTTANDLERQRRLEALKDAGARIVQVPPSADGSSVMPIPVILESLYNLGIYTLMVEGGARIIGSFFGGLYSSRRVVDTIIVTVAPTFVGDEGVGYGVQLGNKVQGFKHVKTEVVGKDAVIVMTNADA